MLEKLEGKSIDIVKNNINKLKEIFPDIFTENKIDVGKMRKILGEHIEDKEERYSFTWNGKSKAIRLAQIPSIGTLRPVKENSKNWDKTKNLYIEGDNLEILKILQKTYYGKIKTIFIDPPYNTENDFVYHDYFSKDKLLNDIEEGFRDENGNIIYSTGELKLNTKSNAKKHTNWLNMMYPRLRLARNLLTMNGTIFITIDDNEYSNLKQICDEVFGLENHLGTIIWKKKTNGNNMGYIPSVHDYILVYAKIASDECLYGLPLSEEYLSKKYSNPDGEPRGPWTTTDLSANHKGPYFEIKNPRTGEGFLPPKGRYWVFNEEECKKRILEGRIIFGKTGQSRPVQKVFLNERKSLRRKADSWWDNNGYNEDGTKEIAELVGTKVFTHPKPVELIKKLCEMSTSKDDIILDFFSGSSTTAHAIMHLNADDNGSRKFIMVQLPETCDEKSEAYKAGYKNICEIGKDRIRRAGEKIIEENKEKDGIENLDVGFKVFRLDTSNIKTWNANFDNIIEQLEHSVNNIKEDRSQEDVLYEILLKYGLDLTLPIEETVLGDKTVSSIGYGALVVCLDDDITLEVVEEIGKLKDINESEVMRVVFKDTGFKNDLVKTNVMQILKRYGIEDVKSI